MGTERLFLLDGHSLSYRAFFALPPDLATTTGQVTNAVYGFTSMLIKLLAEEHPEYVAVAFDKGRPTVRLEQYAEYKAGRAETPDEFRQQLPLIREVLETLRIPIIEVEGHEADDAIATIAERAAEKGLEVVIVTADRDFFQLVRPGIRVKFNRKGISDIVDYDEKAVTERFGVPPDKYVELVALKGDTSDNIPGVPGVGDKTAAKLITEHGTVEEVLEHAADLTPKLRAGIEEAGDDLLRNRELVRLVTDLDLDIEPQECRVGEWDQDQIRTLFNALEFRSLLERLQEVGEPRPAAADVELRIEEGDADAVATVLERPRPAAVALRATEGGPSAIAVSAGDGRAVHAPLDGSLPEPLRAWLEAPDRPIWVHDAKELQAALLPIGVEAAGIAVDTMLAGYLLDPAEASYPIGALSERYLGVDLVGEATETPEEDGQLALQEDDRGPLAAEAAAVAILAPLMAERLERQGAADLLRDVELPLATVLARMQAAGVKIDVPYLQEMSESLGDRMRTLESELYEHAGEEFNLNSPPQLRVILYEKLGLTPGKRTKTGYSTDAATLEKLRHQHPIVEALLSYRELAKLKSTYLDALPPLVSPATGRVHTTFSQVAAATGRLSSLNPNLQNIPVRGEQGREIRKAFIAEEGRVLLVADYSQIELRVLAHLSGDEALGAAFAEDADIHSATAAKVFGLPPEQVDSELRRRAKVVNYGLAYGMNAYGLATRLGIPPDEAKEFIDAYFEGFPRVREFLDHQVTMAAAEGFTQTILGRRRYLPELQSPNPRVRDLGRRMALNAPIQGSAADIIKLAMIRVDQRVVDLPATMVLTVHDELVLEVEEASVEEVAAAVREEMSSAYELSVPLRVDVGSGPTWADATPEGH
ncbi:MAG TPA: DNA polymerase I [Actinomycetota bacterium]